MRVSIAGLWHLGTVTAACCSSVGHEVLAFDDPLVIERLNRNELPVQEPGLADLVLAGKATGKLSFSSNVELLRTSEVLWVTYDTPVDDHDNADIEFVISRVEKLLPLLPADSTVLISSQLPVGSTAKFQTAYPKLKFAYSPENLRLGTAIQSFMKPDRVVLGMRSSDSREILTRLFSPITNNLEWMSIESAEMTKHALNSFLGTSVAFINEIASLCEYTGADALQVERGLKSDIRIGTRSYLHPGAAFSGGTLARDVSFLVRAAERYSFSAHLLSSVITSNSAHQSWAMRRLREKLGALQSTTIGVLGLTYKPGTDTLRRSSSIEICRWLKAQGARIHAYDPAVDALPNDLAETMRLNGSASEAVDGSEAVLIGTAWPEFATLSPEFFLDRMRRPLILDPGRHLSSSFLSNPKVEYVAIGVGQ